ncbi:hypothetical protein BLNAU_2303 [Blattamonas nauphoetae]|uniref:Uncharacterized protein n=1 Tax=Blattamonas nauphoetae TaxID=2049346 RepID=A0ABQ9YGH5_9EUKA|nr:hypothetical protein BLNAU_2303 [Blattamonas nauphoetae]
MKGIPTNRYFSKFSILPSLPSISPQDKIQNQTWRIMTSWDSQAYQIDFDHHRSFVAEVGQSICLVIHRQGQQNNHQHPLFSTQVSFSLPNQQVCPPHLLRCIQGLACMFRPPHTPSRSTPQILLSLPMLM